MRYLIQSTSKSEHAELKCSSYISEESVQCRQTDSSNFVGFTIGKKQTTTLLYQVEKLYQVAAYVRLTKLYCTGLYLSLQISPNSATFDGRKQGVSLSLLHRIKERKMFDYESK